MPFFDPSALVLPTILGTTALALVTAGTGFSFDVRRRRLPEATRLEDAQQQLAITLERLSNAKAELDQVQRAIHDRDRYAAEVAVLTDRKSALEGELAALGPAREEIEAVKRQAVEAAGELSESLEELKQAEDQLAAVRQQLDPARIAELTKQKADLEAELADLRRTLDPLRAERDLALRVIEEARLIGAQSEAMKIKIGELTDEITRHSTRRAELQGNLEELRSALLSLSSEREQAQRTIEEGRLAGEQLQLKKVKLDDLNDEIARGATRAAELERGVDQLKAALASLEDDREQAARTIEEGRLIGEQIKAQRTRLEDLNEEIARQSERKAEISAEVASLSSRREAAEDVIAQANRLEGRLQALCLEFQDSEAKRDALVAKLEALRSEEGAVAAGLAAGRQEVHGLEDECSRLTARIEALRREMGEPTGPALDPHALKADLIEFPSCLSAPGRLRGALRSEAEALHGVRSYLAAEGLRYHPRTINSFHTALKINDHAQLTVLAGVSGTGKSLLPRRYSEAMGIHFLQIAVEPRWDSPQDLLGFYNYVEKRYRATDLARLLVHMDPYGTAEPPEDNPMRRNHVALVLLDEMNLARVEYYFSEFLSRLEARPRYKDVDEERRRKDALIPVDIRGLVNPPSLFPSHNVLFAGTMNDDESTQTLSDKVLDRGNILQFPAPRTFDSPASGAGAQRPDGALDFLQWRSWVLDAAILDQAQRDLAERVVGSLAAIMDRCGRPFGHRMRDAVLAYVANYPHEGNGGRDIRPAMADQVEFRILPKLRGLEIEGHGQQFQELETLVRDDLGDSQLAERIEFLREEQGAATGLFAWRGLAR